MFYAISNLGWGTGDTPNEAEDNYYEIQISNRPSFYSKEEWANRVGEYYHPKTYEAPGNASRFVLSRDGTIRWYDGSNEQVHG